MLGTRGRLVLAAVAVVAVSACGSSGSAKPAATTAAPASSPSPSAAPSSPSPTATFGSSPEPSPAGKIGTKPEVTVPTGPPPAKLLVNDLIAGSGSTAKSGDTVTVQYVGVSFGTKKQFDASWDRGQPFPFRLGTGEVIRGWDQGVVGMHVGGRRQLVIPPDLAYGSRSPGSGIPPNDTLIFVIDLVQVS